MMAVVEDELNARRVHDLLAEACLLLESAENFAIAAYVGHGMSLVEAKYGIPTPGTQDD